jgi:hypothetical protein
MGLYSDINRGPELADAYEKLQTWRKKGKAAKQTDYKSVAKPAADRVSTERTAGYILPFNTDKAGLYLEGRVLATDQQGQGSSTANTARGLIDDRFNDDAPTGNNVTILKIKNYKFAQIILSQRTQTATTESESRKTGIKYKRHRSDNVSGIFGKKSESDTYADAVREIKAKSSYEKFVATKGNRIGFKPEVG